MPAYRRIPSRDIFCEKALRAAEEESVTAWFATHPDSERVLASVRTFSVLCGARYPIVRRLGRPARYGDFKRCHCRRYGREYLRRMRLPSSCPGEPGARPSEPATTGRPIAQSRVSSNRKLEADRYLREGPVNCSSCGAVSRRHLPQPLRRTHCRRLGAVAPSSEDLASRSSCRGASALRLVKNRAHPRGQGIALWPPHPLFAVPPLGVIAVLIYLLQACATPKPLS